jgi:hypothetical protein
MAPLCQRRRREVLLSVALLEPGVQVEIDAGDSSARDLHDARRQAHSRTPLRGLHAVATGPQLHGIAACLGRLDLGFDDAVPNEPQDDAPRGLFARIVAATDRRRRATHDRTAEPGAVSGYGCSGAGEHECGHSKEDSDGAHGPILPPASGGPRLRRVDAL